MALIWLPDSCELPNSVSKRKRKAGEEGGGLAEPMAFGKRTASVASMSSVGSFMSRASARSTASSNCSFARLAPSAEGEDESCPVRIAIGGL